MAAQKLLGFHAGIADFGRFLGLLNGWGVKDADISGFFEVFGPWWQAAAVNSYPVLRAWAENERRPHIDSLESVLEPLFG